MMTNNCPLTGLPLTNANSKIYPTTFPGLEYEFVTIGKAIITDVACSILPHVSPEKRSKLAGMSRNYSFENSEAFEIKASLIEHLDKEKTPTSIIKKSIHLLKFLYKKSGSASPKFEFLSSRDYTIAYAFDVEEFNRIINLLLERRVITVENITQISEGIFNYDGVQLTSTGVRSAAKQIEYESANNFFEISKLTGDAEIDEKISAARNLYFDVPQTLSNLIIAFDILEEVLNPLRLKSPEFFNEERIPSVLEIAGVFNENENQFSSETDHMDLIKWKMIQILNIIYFYFESNGGK